MNNTRQFYFMVGGHGSLENHASLFDKYCVHQFEIDVCS